MEEEKEVCGSKKKAKIEENSMISTNSKKKNLLYPCLPQDLVTEIRSHLPVTSLQRFRSVCKSWNLMITTQVSAHFVSRHLKNRLNCANNDRILKFSCFWPEGYEFVTPVLYYPVGDEVENPVEFNLNQEVEKQKYYFITNSCDGLIGIYGILSVYIVNPSIRKAIVLPGESPHYSVLSDIPSVGIGFDESIRKYKVVRLFRRKTEPEGYTVGCEVYTLGTHGSSCWKMVDDPSFDPFCSSHYWSVLCCLPVVVNGAIHWTVNQDGHGNGREIALSFNLSTEKFDVVLRPKEHIDSLELKGSHVVSLEGRLGIIDTYDFSGRSKMCIWVMKNYTKREWVKEYNVNLRMTHRLIFPSVNPSIVMILNNRIIVLSDRRGARYYYDIRTNRFLRKVKDENVHFEQLVTHVDSLVWPWS